MNEEEYKYSEKRDLIGSLEFLLYAKHECLLRTENKYKMAKFSEQHKIEIRLGNDFCFACSFVYFPTHVAASQRSCLV